mmetsp:Transcript_11058/g.28047  ORF Transcript_11058/g.28047 Transcript_11058/m.28047 type:complete len:1293 (+) Transcript_11058:181-4059(+)
MESETIAPNAFNLTSELDIEKLVSTGINDFVPLILGCFGIGCSLLLFGYGVYRGWIDDLTPRIANRPKNVLKNAMLHHLPKWMSSPIWYPITWIGWAYYLTYDECIKGIPGTGTRKDGTEGPLLKTNLDAIIMLRYHTLMFKVGMVVFVLCTFVIFPVNWTATCNVEIFGYGTCFLRAQNQTFFERSSIANVPDKIFNPTNETVDITFQTGDVFLGFNELNTNSTSSVGNVTDFDRGVISDGMSDGISDGIQLLTRRFWVREQSARVLVLVISCVLIYLYTFYLLTWQWIENVALRRKYFLEATHYSKRTKELNELALEKDEIDNRVFDAIDLSEGNLESDQVLASRLRQKQMNENKNRPEYLTHPEITETPPSIGIFSVLYQLPRSMVTYDTDGATTLERQLVATSNFFDEIVPPEPGFSSSVAAVTVLPNAKLVSRARAKWEICEKKAQKLRYTRKKLRLAIQKQEKYERQELERQESLFRSNSEAPAVQRDETPEVQNGQPRTTATRINTDGSIESFSSDEKPTGRKPPLQEDESKTPELIKITKKGASTKSSSTMQSDPTISFRNNDVKDTSRNATSFRYEDFSVSEYASSMGFHEEVHDICDFVNGMDIEEFNVFAYRCALLAGSNPGFDKRIFRLYGIETLRELERDLMKELQVANQELLQARRDVVMIADENELKGPPAQPSMPCDDEDSIIENYGDCEVTGNLSIGLRKRKASGIDNGNDGVWETSPDNRGTIEGNDYDAGDDVTANSKPSIIRRLWAPLKCILLIPRRVYRGIGGDDEWRETLKYYGMKDISDTETGRKGFVTNVNHPSYAVVTFTTRHAAVIARQCLADGAPQNHWKNVDDMPFYPLADAPSWEITRPVTPTISYASKKFRQRIASIVTVVFTIVNVYVVQWINRIFLNPNLFSAVFGIPYETAESWSTTASGFTQTLLFSVSSYLFEILANIEGSATSEGKSEQKALIYFWYFYFITRYMGQIVWGIAVKFWEGSSVETSINEGITELARTVPTTLGPAAWSYIIFAATITWPAIYFLQLPNLGTRFLRLSWFNRLMKEGGPGAEVPYRFYVDSGYVFASMTALAPLCPMLGVSCLMYFIIIIPVLRWLLVFAYRPKFDGGGDKWPTLHHIIVSSLILGQIITSITLFLKQNSWEGLFIGFWIIPTLAYHNVLLEKYARPYLDAALLQTRRMYSHAGNDGANAKSSLRREEYRRWLVDCHKASYLPTCLSGGKDNLLTSEPAVVTSEGMSSMTETVGCKDNHEEIIESTQKLLKRQQSQKGGILHRQRFNI